MEQTDTTIINTISEQFAFLPKELQVLLTTTPWLEVIDEIAKKYGLTEEQTADLRQETYFILLGMEPLSLFRANLIRMLEITYDQSIKISFEINNRILNPVIDILKKIESQLEQIESGENETSSPEEQVEPPLSSPENSLQNEINVETEPAAQDKIVDAAPRTTPDTNPEHLVPDHTEMEKLDGPHIHSQTVISTEQKGEQKAEVKPEPKPEQKSDLGSRFGNFIPQSKKSFGSIVDEKLSGIVTSNTENNTLSEKPAPKNGYTGQDPYREPIE